jgi:hypothetical protein
MGTLSGTAAFSGANTYTCYGSDTTTPTMSVTFTYLSGTSFEAMAPAGDNVRWICIGT